MKKKIALSLLAVLVFFTSFVNAQTARVQIIHNSADAAAASVDVWLNDTKLIENFAFRTATPFIDAPAGVLLNIGIATPNSTSWTQSFRIKQVVLTENQTYVIIANGIISAGGYSPIQDFDLRVYPGGRESAINPEEVDLLVYHGSTDAPTVSVSAVGVGTLIEDFFYGTFAGYLSVAENNYTLTIDVNEEPVLAYLAPLSELELAGHALTVLASGFLNPEENSNGAGFGLWVALASGGELIELPATTAGVRKLHNDIEVTVFPNPTQDNITINIPNELLHSKLQIFDAQGKLVYKTITDDNSIEINVQSFRNELFFITINNSIYSFNTQFIVK